MPEMNSRRLRGLILTGVLAVGGATAAVAATPESGEVSKASPKIKWSGEVTASYFNRLAMLLADIAGQGGSVPCAPDTCDSFALKVADQDDLTITADAPESEGTTGSGSQVSLRITRPDGSKEIHTTDTDGASPKKPLTVKIKNAPTGDYTIEYFNYFTDGPIAYNATATLGGAVVAPAPEAPAPGTGQPGGEQPAPSNPNVRESLTVTAKVGKASAKKLNKAKALKATITVSRAVQSATATLKSGSKVVGTGKLGAFSGSKAVTLKLKKKLKAGKYTLVFAATDAQGSTGGSTLAVKVGK